MARPKKTGLDYFPLDVNFDQDDKVVIIIGKYGMEGLGVLIKLMMEVYKNGYFYKWTEREQIVFSSRINVDINLVNDIVNDCIKWSFFNENKFKEHEILTSKGFQERYSMATTRRLGCEIQEEYRLYFEEPKDQKEPPEKTEKPKVKKPKEPKETPNYIEKIKELLTRYPEEFLQLNKQYWGRVKETRRNGKISESVIFNTMNKWKKYDVKIVECALKVHIGNNLNHREEYTLGIMRNMKPEEVEQKLKNIGVTKQTKQTREAAKEGLNFE